jgi:hypothetical protein
MCAELTVKAGTFGLPRVYLFDSSHWHYLETILEGCQSFKQLTEAESI